jgi:uncharacterized membrane protein YqiK
VVFAAVSIGSGSLEGLVPIAVACVLLLLVFGALALVLFCRPKVPRGTALILHRGNRPPRVLFESAVVFPVLDRVESISLVLHDISLSLRGA